MRRIGKLGARWRTNRAGAMGQGLSLNGEGAMSDGQGALSQQPHALLERNSKLRGRPWQFSGIVSGPSSVVTACHIRHHHRNPSPRELYVIYAMQILGSFVMLGLALLEVFHWTMIGPAAGPLTSTKALHLHKYFHKMLPGTQTAPITKTSSADNPN